MNKSLINNNIINQINNKDLYEPNLLKFLLTNSDLELLKSKTYEAVYIDGVYFKSNFSGLIFSKFYYDEKSDMKNEILKYYGVALGEPSYIVDITNKSHNNELSKRVFLLFRKGFNEYFTNLYHGKEEPLNDSEEKFFINYILNKSIFTNFSEETKHEIYKILSNQKEFLQFKNSKSQTNIFLQNENLKKVLDLYSNTEVDFLMGEQQTSENLIQLYFKKLHRSKVFDLNVKLKDREPSEIYQAMESVLGKYSDLNWFKSLIKYGTNCGLEYFDKAYKDNKINEINVLSLRLNSGDRKPKAIMEMLQLIDMIKDVSSISSDVDSICKLFLIVSYSNREDQYLKLRSMFEIPEKAYTSFSELKIGKKSFKELESQILNDKLEKELYSNQQKNKRIKL